MTQKTHIVVGIASAVTVASLTGAWPAARDLRAVWYCAVAGGALGGILPDLDCRTGRRSSEARSNRILAALITVSLLFLDWVSGTEILRRAVFKATVPVVAGMIGTIFVCILIRFSRHRGFSHSLLALALLCLSLSRILFPVIPYFAAGFLSHILLDLLNKKRVHLLFPLGEGFCLRLCASDGAADRLVFIAGFLWFGAAAAAAVL